MKSRGKKQGHESKKGAIREDRCGKWGERGNKKE
jgi:hypothetical protein